MEYSLAEEMLLAVSTVAIDAYHALRDRPRTFWGTWAVGFAVLAVILFRPGHHTSSEL